MSVQQEFDLPISYYRISEDNQIGSFKDITDICYTLCAIFVG